MDEVHIAKPHAAVKIGYTQRHVNRLLKRYQQEGKAAFLHGNTGRKPAHALSLRKKIKEIGNDTFTQFSYVCKQLGIELKTTSVAQAKGRVEQLFQILQSYLLVELQLQTNRRKTCSPKSMSGLFMLLIFIRDNQKWLT